MDFVDVEPLRERAPLIEIMSGGRKIDLHNDCLLTNLEYDLTGHRLWVRFASSSVVSHNERTPTAFVTLVLDGVRSLGFNGEVSRAPTGEPMGLDFIEYTRLESALGKVRFVFDSDFEIEVEATRLSASLVA